MTVIAYVWVPDGFVIGADGRVLNEETRKPDNDNKIKLIRLKGPGVDFICGWAGGAGIKSSDGRAFDLTDEVERVGKLLAGEHLGDHYVNKLSEKLLTSRANQISYLLARLKGCPENRPRALFLGYLDGRPQRWEWTLGAAPTKEVLPRQCFYTAHSGCCRFEECDLKGRSAFTLDLGAQGLRNYIECCKKHSCDYGGETQILIIRRP